MQCANCGQPLQAGVAFCPWCGGAVARPAPPPVESRLESRPPTKGMPPRVPATPFVAGMPVGAGGPGGGGSGWRLPALVIGVVVLMAVAGIVVVLAFHHDAAAAPPADSGVVPDSAVSVGAPPVTPSPDYAGPTTDPNQPRDDGSAKAALDNEVAQDKGAAEQLVDHWVPQLSSKRPGLVADGTLMTIRRFGGLRTIARPAPGRLLIWSGELRQLQVTDFYVPSWPHPTPTARLPTSGVTPRDRPRRLLRKVVSHNVAPMAPPCSGVTTRTAVSGQFRANFRAVVLIPCQGKNRGSIHRNWLNRQKWGLECPTSSSTSELATRSLPQP